MGTTSDSTLNDFFEVMNGPSHLHDVNYLLSSVFCQQNSAKTLPSVGITSDGPQFRGGDAVLELFSRLFSTFDDFRLKPSPNAPRLYSSTPSMIAIQTRLTGKHVKLWFPSGHDFYSPPISDIDPDGQHSTEELPAAAFFAFGTFNNNILITNLSIYFDRYKMWQDLTCSPHTIRIKPAKGRRLVVRIDEA
jgi:hypothetical protein